MGTDVCCDKCRHFSGLPVRFHFAAYPVRYCDQAETFILGDSTISKSCNFYEHDEAEEKKSEWARRNVAGLPKTSGCMQVDAGL
jgi:hypothetical protein